MREEAMKPEQKALIQKAIRTTDEAVAKLDAINASDPEKAHMLAENVLYELAPREVQDAFDRVADRCDWWAYA